MIPSGSLPIGDGQVRPPCCEKPAPGAEGSSPKRADSRYVSTRSTDWLKLKCVRQQEFVIGGYTAPQGTRERLGALLVGYYDGKILRYAGKVGTGYDRRTLEELSPSAWCRFHRSATRHFRGAGTGR